MDLSGLGIDVKLKEKKKKHKPKISSFKNPCIKIDLIFLINFLSAIYVSKYLKAKRKIMETQIFHHSKKKQT